MNDPTWCDYHKGPQTSVLIKLDMGGSGPGFGSYACAPCRAVKRLKPLLEVEEAPEATQAAK